MRVKNWIVRVQNRGKLKEVVDKAKTFYYQKGSSAPEEEWNSRG
jgi:hypothetical protein